MNLQYIQNLKQTLRRDQEKHNILADVEKITKLMDSQFEIPGLGIPVGLDFIIGLIPVAGDTVTTGAAIYTIFRYWQSGVPLSKLLKMAVITIIDFLVGSIPVIGDLFDLGFRSFHRNWEIWQEWQATKETNKLKNK